MKQVSFGLIIMVTGLQVFAAPLLGADHSLKGAQIRVCQPQGEICLTIEGRKTVGSQIQAYHVIENPVVVIENRKTKRVQKIHPFSAYIDLVNGQVGWNERLKGGRSRDVYYNLDSVERQETQL